MLRVLDIAGGTAREIFRFNKKRKRGKKTKFKNAFKLVFFGTPWNVARALNHCNVDTLSGYR